MKPSALPLVSLNRNRAVTTSLIVAEKFRKRHKTVLRKIENIDGPKSFTERNFALSEYTDPSGRKLPMYLLTRDGFTLLAMSFTGREATQWKIKYLNAFNTMEAALRRRQSDDWQKIRGQGKAVRFELTDAIQEFIQYSQEQGSTHAGMYFVAISKMTRQALFIICYRAPKGFRDLLDNMQLIYLQTAEFVARNAIREGMQRQMLYRDIYQLARERVTAFAETVGRTSVPAGTRPVLPAKRPYRKKETASEHCPEPSANRRRKS